VTLSSSGITSLTPDHHFLVKEGRLIVRNPWKATDLLSIEGATHVLHRLYGILGRPAWWGRVKGCLKR
jgi:hypothetical protein